jgi:hypothetical protein
MFELLFNLRVKDNWEIWKTRAMTPCTNAEARQRQGVMHTLDKWGATCIGLAMNNKIHVRDVPPTLTVSRCCGKDGAPCFHASMVVASREATQAFQGRAAHAGRRRAACTTSTHQKNMVESKMEGVERCGKQSRKPEDQSKKKPKQNKT